MQPESSRFPAPQISDAIYVKDLNSLRKLGMLHPEFIPRVNSTMVYLTCPILCDQLQAYPLAVYQDPPDIKSDTVGGRTP